MSETGEGMKDMVLTINMNPRDGCHCAVCGGNCDHGHGVPMLEGKLVSNEWAGPWGGFPACLDCYNAHADGRLRTYDAELAHYLADGAKPMTLAEAARRLEAAEDELLRERAWLEELRQKYVERVMEAVNAEASRDALRREVEDWQHKHHAAVGEAEGLQEKCRALTKERDHWKANHGNVVRSKRVKDKLIRKLWDKLVMAKKADAALAEGKGEGGRPTGC